MPVSAHGRVPRARIDPILSSTQALTVFGLAISCPLEYETMVMFLDSTNCGHELVSVSGTEDPFHILDVADAMALSASTNPDLGSLVLASVRPLGGLTPDDADLWFEADDAVEQSGLVLIDWFVIGCGCGLNCNCGVCDDCARSVGGGCGYAQSAPAALGLPSRWLH